MKRLLSLALAVIPALAAAQEPGDSIVRVALDPDGAPARAVMLLDQHGPLAWAPVPDLCERDACILRLEVELPSGNVWAVAVNDAGASPPSNVRSGGSYPTVYELSDINGDGRVDVIDLLQLSRSLHAGAPGDSNQDGSVDVGDILTTSGAVFAPGQQLSADANRDGRVDVADVLFISRSIFGEQGDDPADVNLDGRVDVSDVLMLSRMISAEAP